MCAANICSGNQTLVLHESSKHFNSWAISPAPVSFYNVLVLKTIHSQTFKLRFQFPVHLKTPLWIFGPLNLSSCTFPHSCQLLSHVLYIPISWVNLSLAPTLISSLLSLKDLFSFSTSHSLSVSWLRWLWWSLLHVGLVRVSMLWWNTMIKNQGWKERVNFAYNFIFIFITEENQDKN